MKTSDNDRPTKPVALITGCSTGIGRAIAQSLHPAGWAVVASARRIEDLSSLESDTRLQLDVRDQASVQAAIRQIQERYGRLDLLVNNAGFAVRGAIEEITEEAWRDMYDVNVFGLIRTTRCAADLLRQTKGSRVINIGSIAGRMTMPVSGAYSSTKFAVECLSDALRWELGHFGVRVILIQPGNIRSNFVTTAARQSNAVMDNPDSPYAEIYRRYQAVTEKMRHHEPGPERVAQTVLRALQARRPKARYQSGVSLPHLLVTSAPDWLKDRMMRRMFGLKSI